MKVWRILEVGHSRSVSVELSWVVEELPLMEGGENAAALVRACFLDDAERRGPCRFAMEEKARQLVAHESIREMAMILIYFDVWCRFYFANCLRNTQDVVRSESS